MKRYLQLHCFPEFCWPVTILVKLKIRKLILPEKPVISIKRKRNALN